MISSVHILNDLTQLKRMQQVNFAFAQAGSCLTIKVYRPRCRICRAANQLRRVISQVWPQQTRLRVVGLGSSVPRVRKDRHLCGLVPTASAASGRQLPFPALCMGRAGDILALPGAILVFRLEAQSSTPVRLIFTFLSTALSV